MRLTYRALNQNGEPTKDVFYNAMSIKTGDNIFPQTDKEKMALKKLAAYEDTGFEPEEIDFCLSGAISPQEAKERYEAHKKRYDEWFAWKQAEEQGRLVILPCKVGDTVYVEWSEGREYSKSVVEKISIGNDGQVRFLIPAYLHSHSVSSYQTSDFGKTVFLSREEAEAALKGESKDV